MKKITVISVSKVVAIIDYRQLETKKENGSFMRTEDILAHIQKTISLPKYQKILTDEWERKITLVDFYDKIVVEEIPED